MRLYRTVVLKVFYLSYSPESDPLTNMAELASELLTHSHIFSATTAWISRKLHRKVFYHNYSRESDPLTNMAPLASELLTHSRLFLGYYCMDFKETL